MRLSADDQVAYMGFICATGSVLSAWLAHAQLGDAAQPEPASDMMSSLAPALMFSMLAQSMFWGTGGWTMPGMLSEPTPQTPLLGNGDLLEAGAMSDWDDAGGLDFGGEF
ncbi:MAG: hypothetical protein D6709_10940 [Chloroflexi bacterium]|uniref:Uncharacterized protein n=1 Tax=Candidatus Thermofonsia Clade 3 bacterium TaxID=2364212 RepID=A0A2M8QER3_9CHLR|nr:MAG: hypothetical protein CUN48_04140 [Candidatus Thermofonsia Clade 3 bacterium]RMG62647.1 MAG: hypothetical protein D6709_10940 [Chloroflexota bacterium]